MSRTLTKIKRARYMDGFQPLTDLSKVDTVLLPVGSAVAIAKGDCVTISSGYLALATAITTAGKPNVYIALDENTAAEASSNGAVSCRCIPVNNPNVTYSVPVTTNAVLAQATHVGNIYGLDGSEDGISVASALSADIGFMVEQIDISTEAVAVNTYGYAIGRFASFAETT